MESGGIVAQWFSMGGLFLSTYDEEARFVNRRSKKASPGPSGRGGDPFHPSNPL